MTGSTLCALAVSTEMLIAARVLQGLGGGGLISLSQALIGQSVPPRERAQYQGYIAAVAVIASTVGPVIGGLLTEFFGWRSIFLFNIPFGLVAILLLLRLPPGTGQKEPFRFDWLGLILFATFVWSTLILVEALRGRGPQTLGVSAILVLIAITAMIGLYIREKRTAQPLLPVTLLENPSIWRADALAMSHGALFVSLIAFVPIYLRAVHGASAAEIGLMMLPMTAGVGFGGFVVGQVVSKTGRTAIFPSLGLMIVGAMLLFLAFFAPLLSMVQFSWYLGALSVFLGTVMGVVQVTVQSEAGKKMLGAAAASVAVARSFGGRARHRDRRRGSVCRSGGDRCRSRRAARGRAPGQRYRSGGYRCADRGSHTRCGLDGLSQCFPDHLRLLRHRLGLVMEHSEAHDLIAASV